LFYILLDGEITLGQLTQISTDLPSFAADPYTMVVPPFFHALFSLASILRLTFLVRILITKYARD
jgi:hypothetical protein